VAAGALVGTAAGGAAQAANTTADAASRPNILILFIQLTSFWSCALHVARRRL
jgi:hypothetical protein